MTETKCTGPDNCIKLWVPPKVGDVLKCLLCAHEKPWGSWQRGVAVCDECRDRAQPPLPLHRSDCALHNGPALPIGPCDCKPLCPTCKCSGEVFNEFDPAQGNVECEDCDA